MIRAYHVTKRYGDVHALRDVTVKLGKGEFCYVTGPSGAGKTTMLKMLYGSVIPTEGKLLVGGVDISKLSRRRLPYLRRNIGIVFQDFKLLANRSVEENVGFALDVVGTPRREARSRVFNTLRQVGLQHRRYHHPMSLSGGEQQRVAIARALVGDPEILLADEPTGNLDPGLSVEIIELMMAAANRGTTVIVATHDIALVERYRMRTLKLEDGRLSEVDLEGDGR